MSTGERQEIEAAIQRLLKGCPLRSSGELTVVQLAVEADIKRWRLTHQHVDLMHEFQAAVRRANGASEVEARLSDRVARLKADLADAQGEITRLRENLAVYAQVINDLDSAIAARGGNRSPVRSIRRERGPARPA